MQTYSHKKKVLIGDTNIMQNMYFANFFKLQGEVRELFLLECVSESMNLMQQGLILITKDAHMDFIKDFYLHDTIRIELSFPKLGAASCELNFKFFDDSTNELHAHGSQTIVFADQNHKITKMPSQFKSSLSLFSPLNQTDNSGLVM